MEDNHAIERFLRAQESLVTQQSDFSLETIRQMVSNGAIDLSPKYQRRDRWDTKKQSALIESFILNVPVPPVYLSEEDYGSYSVIDGKQRITSISSFLNDEFKLTGLEKFEELNGYKFSDLPKVIINALTVRPYVRMVSLLRQSDPSLKYEVFLRLNTGGQTLNPQEVRNVAYSGPLNDLLYELAENEYFRMKMKITGINSPSYRSMNDLEHILRFFTINERGDEIGGNLTKEMDFFMLEFRKADEGIIQQLRSNFNTALERCQEIWPDKAFNKPIESGWREQLISPLFDAQMVAVLKLSSNEFESLKDRKVEMENLIVDLYGTNRDFEDSVSKATNNRLNILRRIEILQTALLSYV